MIGRLTKDLPHYDLCIIGAGPAGLTVAAELAYANLRICVLESGTEKQSSFGEMLKEVISDGLAIKSNSRERVVGGTSTTWQGLSAPLDTIDLTGRFGHDAWPLTEGDMAPYLARAARYRFPMPEDFVVVPTSRRWRLKNLEEKIFVAIRPPYNFAALRPIFEREGVDLYIDATVTLLASTVGRVTHAVCKTRALQEIPVYAKTFVLASGGIENPRLLLASSLGNEYDQVGRYFMNHPKGYAGLLRLKTYLPNESLFLPRTIRGRLRYAGLRLSEEYQRAHGLLNACVQFEPNLGWMQRYAFGIWRRLPAFARPWSEMLRPRTLRPRWFADMEPRAENRVLLGEKRDPLGMPLPIVRHELGDRDKKTFGMLHAQLKENIERLGLGKLEGTADEILSAVTLDASHHLGGTRMGRDAHSSVVDPDCKVHSVSNLYIAGGSVFPTGGCANPTYTIVALAIRLAERLRTLAGTDTSRREKIDGAGIIIIGAGKRVTSDVVPALESLKGTFTIQGLYARHSTTLCGSHRRYEVSPLSSLTTNALKGARFLYIAVPPQSLLSVIQSLPAESRDMELIIDTPVPLSIRLRFALAHYRRVHVAEDSVFLPWLSIVSNPVTRIECIRSVYRYHGVALIKTLAGAVRSGLRWRNSVWLWAHSARVHVIEPRDYTQGTFRINGREIQLLIEKSQCKGFRIETSTVFLSPEESQLAGFMEEGDTIISRMLELKRVGLRRLLVAAHKREPTWSLGNGINDALIDYLVHRFWFYISPKEFFRYLVRRAFLRISQRSASSSRPAFHLSRQGNNHPQASAEVLDK